MRMSAWLSSAFLVMLLGGQQPSQSAMLGDWGHFMSYSPRIHLLNPDGRAFTVKVHAMQWGRTDWNGDTREVRLTAPGGEVLQDGHLALENAVATLEVPAGAAGVYVLEPKGNNWVSTTLDRAVLWTGLTEGHMVDDRRAVFQAVVPRRWWFWVPPEVTGFTVKAQRADRYMSQREDWGFFIITPRGQRIRALWGEPPHAGSYRQDQVAEVPVEPGAGGRFWALEVQLGDSHDYSNINICFDGVPPYLAQSPETWFNPDTGMLPEVPLYDETPFIQSAKTPMSAERWPDLQHFSPCPSLGDPDGVAILGDARFALWNPENRPLGFRIGAYLPRRPAGDPEMADVVITGPSGDTVFEKSLPILHVHGSDGHPTDTINTGAGVSVVDVKGPEHWLSFTYPATPLVLLGESRPDGWNRYRFTAASPRNWYFWVPPGATTFQVRFETERADDVLRLDVRSPDRTQAILHGREGAVTVTVPAGLDGRIWHLRPSVAGASRLITDAGPAPRYQNIRLTLELNGLPDGLAPTWEQWFNPVNPVPPQARPGQ